jgi:hypothetical protein
MSRTLRRPMFRGGRVSAYGTGIASGLADGGRVGYWRDFQGGMVLGSELYPKPNITTLEDLQNAYQGANWASRNIVDQKFEKEVGSEGDVVEVGIEDLDIDTRTDEQKAIDADIRSEQTAKEELKESALASIPIKKKKTIGELELEKIRAELEQLRKDGAGSESLDIDKKTYLKLLGGDKAKGEDISSMLLGFAGAEGDTVMEKFQKFAATEATRPSKRKSLEEASAMLAIKDYIAGKRSKEQLDVLLGQLDYKSLLSKKNLAEHISESRKTRSGVGAIKDGVQAWRPGVKIEEVTSTEALEFGPEDEGTIFIETDTKDVYTIKDGGKVPLYTS